ncbi:hypothetical protein G5C60_31310 [Streptomyces sp. HC44]|uniref:Uncharacterized protein n=1 Tax=Streptomyces scabichelini TaxID=2711217 RepID=A0A6G4VDW3_9ACTN|nr:hypothetical protein [Streptomyces scabichelini]NGO11973.1 hypothetical protein [Streptomyces scabichelini]
MPYSSEGQHVDVEGNRTPEILVKFLVLAGLLYLVTRVFYWGEWIPFAGASVYLQYRQRQESDRHEYHRN